jgi:uncharacterized protein YifE (UPF0438 family)
VLVRFVIVHHPQRGTIFLLCTDLTLEPLQILTLYGYRFKIELGFRQAVRAGLPAFIAVCDLVPGLKKMVEVYRR